MDQAATAPVKPDARTHPRCDLDLMARLTTDTNELIGFAKVQNISDGGAKLVLSDEIKTLPSQFDIVLCSNSSSRRNCSVVWQSNNLVGVSFT